MNADNAHPPVGADQLLKLIAAACAPLAAERTDLAAANGCVLREPALAPEDQPPFDRSSVDGYAVRLDDPASEFKIVGEIRAGDWKPHGLSPGECIRIATGGAVPGNGLQVVMREDVTVTGQDLQVVRRSKAQHIRFRGEDARQGQTLVAAGTKLSAGSLALLASLGCAQPLVTRPPNVTHFATGNEIVPPSQAPQRGQIRDSNSTLVRTFLQAWNARLVQDRLPEDEAAVRDALVRHLPGTDLLLISGGASVGEHDFTKRLLAEAGFEILTSKTNLRPGKPLILAKRSATVAFGLPGNPLAHFVCLHAFVRPALEHLSGLAQPRLFQEGRLAEELAGIGNARETFWPARLDNQAGTHSLTGLPWNSSGDLTALAHANALIRIAPNQPDWSAGAIVQFISLH